MYEGEFAETLAADEADTLETKPAWFERAWYKQRTPEFRAPPTTPAPRAYQPMSAAWSAERKKTASRLASRQVSHIAGAINKAERNRARESRRLSKFEELLRSAKANIAESIRRRKEYEKQLAAAEKELDALA